MNKRKFIKLTILVSLIFITNILIFKFCNIDDKNITLSYKIVSNEQDSYQVFYGTDMLWSEEQSQRNSYTNINRQETLKFSIPKDITNLRFDFGEHPANINVSEIKLSCWGKSINIDLNEILNENNENQIGEVQEINNSLNIETIGNDPYVVYKMDSTLISGLIEYEDSINNAIKLGSCILIDILAAIVLRKSRSVLILIQELKNNKTLIWSLSKNDFKTKYAGSYLGIIWAFIQPIVTILVYWFVFEYGLKSGSPIKGVPFIVWFMSGLVPWFFFQEALLNATNCMLEYTYLVKKVVFKISILPIVKILSALFVHLVFIVFLFFVAAIYRFYPSLYTTQLIYYSFCTFCIVLGISYATSAIVIFFKDLGQIINIFLQVGMWLTPIMWSYTMVPQQYQWILKLSPMYYIVEGYRDTFINHVWFYERYFQTIYFWVVTLGVFAIGAVVFKKLKPHFADVL
ncbi:ABC transporter permease [Clostridium sp. 2-1]|uniref:ABC transporter permease n=1 Tax=Clostridium TaxID=1485 RepID=UPI000CDAC0BD|nr:MULTISPECIES: ABC transporter permease [Clostridium]AVK48689.1 ABC transporter [Clostridium sp. MF28]MBN7573235.1 ABC transporter permease [Clostridium beijerinckii]MBN7578574.1 ABC transporter permease [Clostridium beijerinckii]MBN7583009.1 ABC transporter permease [Clostridium beijerinckii]MBO0519188.1 ABC transporter permease [Clostridium beijerinckii]